MKQVLLSTAGQIEVMEVPVPGPIAGSILVQNHYSLISTGTESASVTLQGGWRGLYKKFRSSSVYAQKVWNLVQNQGVKKTYEIVKSKLDNYSIIGYSCAGKILEVTNRDLPFVPGQKVACMGVGFASHAEYVVIPENLAVVVENVPLDQASFAAISCIAMQGIRRLELTPGEYIGVVGLGLIGQVCVRLLSAMGYQIVAIDLLEERATKAKEIANVEAWSSSKVDSLQRVMQITKGRGLDGVIIAAATKSSEPVNMGFDLCRQKGRVSIIGDVGLELSRQKMYRKELELRLSCSYGPGRYDPNYELQGQDYPYGYVRWSERRNLEYFLGLLAQKKLDISSLISHKFSISKAAEAYALAKNAQADTFGILFNYDVPVIKSSEVQQKRIVTLSKFVKQGHKIGIGLIGTGGYTRAMHIPNLKKLENLFQVVGMASRSGSSATIAARTCPTSIVTSDYKELLENKDINAVLISTRHKDHAKIVLEALDAGKHVFVEKPMAITIEDCMAIVEKQQETGLLVRVGFNRRFSPFIISMKEAVSKGKKIFTVRVNIGQISGDWSNTREEGGRLLGEGVHFFDLCNWFMDQEPVSISAMIAGENEITNPNVHVQIYYPDSSLAQVTYTTLGHSAMGKEYFEAFGNSRCVKSDDYNTLHSWGASTATGAKGDKGQLKVLEEFANAIYNKNFPNQGADARAGLIATWMAINCYTSFEKREHICLDI